MTYRNESDALRARVQKLEDELALATDTIARLRSVESTAGDVMGRQAEHDVTLPGSVSEAARARIAAMVEARLAVRVMARNGGGLEAPGVFWLDHDGRGTRMRIAYREPNVAAAVARGRFIGAVVPGAPVLLLLSLAGQHAMPGVALQAVWIVPAIVLAAGALMARTEQRAASAGRERARQTLDAARDIALADLSARSLGAGSRRPA